MREGAGGLRIGVLDGWFRAGATADALDAVDRVSTFLEATPVTIPGADVARAAAFCISAAEGANRHLGNLKTRARDFDPATRDRLLAGALVPAAVILQAQRFRSWFRDRVAEIFTRYDVLIAPATPFSAPLIGEETVMIGDQRVLARANIGIYTQPISFIGLPVLTAPIHRPGKMPLGVQIIAAPWAEAATFRVAAALEEAGIARAPIAERLS
jgi:Asp-tRNA(Asn)/Glu-tRNA(Gln) amidotransferase A subunit family amidase